MLDEAIGLNGEEVEIEDILGETIILGLLMLSLVNNYDLTIVIERKEVFRLRLNPLLFDRL